MMERKLFIYVKPGQKQHSVPSRHADWRTDSTDAAEHHGLVLITTHAIQFHSTHVPQRARTIFYCSNTSRQVRWRAAAESGARARSAVEYSAPADDGGAAPEVT